MSAIKYIERLKRMDYLIRTRNTGSPGDFAAKLGISERSLYEYINAMRELGAPVAYSYHDNSYIYIKDGNFKISFLLKDSLPTYNIKGKGAGNQSYTHLNIFLKELTQLQKYCSMGFYF